MREEYLLAALRMGVGADPVPENVSAAARAAFDLRVPGGVPARPVDLPVPPGTRSSPAAETAQPGVRRFSADGLVIDTARRSVQRLGQTVDLTGTEYELLLMLARDPGRVFSRDDILNRLRGHEAELYTRAVDIVVSRLRRKLEPLEAIKTLRNAGYALALPRLAG